MVNESMLNYSERPVLMRAAFLLNSDGEINQIQSACFHEIHFDMSQSQT